MGKILKNWLIGIFGFVFCVTCGALGVMHYPTVENAVAEETLISYTDAELAAYDIVSVYNIAGAEELAIPAVAQGEYATRNGEYVGTSANTTGSTVFKFELTLNSANSCERLITLRKNGTSSYRFYFGLGGVNAMVGVFENNILRDASEQVPFHTGAPATYQVEIGAIDLINGNGVWQYMKINGELLISVVQNPAPDAYTKMISAGGNDSSEWTLSQWGVEIQILEYSDEELAVYDRVSVQDLFGVNTYAVPAAFGSYAEQDVSYVASPENTTGSTVFEFRLTLNSVANFERLISMRKNVFSAYRFYIGILSDKVMLATIDNGVVGNTSDRIVFISDIPSTVDMEIGAIDLLDGSGVWQYVKVNGELILSIVQPKIEGANTTNICVGGNDIDPWLLTQLGEEPVMPEQPEKVDYHVPAFTDDELAVYDVFSVYEAFETREFVMFGSSSYYETERSYILNQHNTTDSAVFRFMLSQDDIAETKEKLITLRSAENGLYGYRFYVGPIRLAICNNGGGIDASFSPLANIAFENGEWYEVEFGAIDLADGSGVWQYAKVNGELVLSTVRAPLPMSAANIRIGGNATEDWKIRDMDYDNLPENEQPVRTGITTEKTDGYNNVTVHNIEDLMNDVAYMGLGFSTTKTEEGNLRLERVPGNDVTPLMQLKAKSGVKFTDNFGIKFASVNESVPESEAETVFCPLLQTDVTKNTTIELGLELCAPSMGIYWGSGSGYLAYFVWDPINDMCRVMFFPKGPSFSTDGISVIDLCALPDYDPNFLPYGERYTVEYGCFTSDVDREFTLYILITNANGEEMYAAMTWDAQHIYSNAKEGGFIRISGLSYERSSPFEILPVDENSSIYENYNPVYTEASRVVEHDISDYLPIGQDGVTYTTKSAEETLDIINISKMGVNTKNDMYLRFNGDYNLRFAFFTDRADGKNCTAGYHVVFTPNDISILSYSSGFVHLIKTAEYAMPENENVHISIRLVQLYIEGLLQGVRVTVYVEGEELVSSEFALQISTLPPYFDGQMSGNGSVTILPYDTTVTATNGIALDVKDDEVKVGKQIRLKYELTKATEKDVVSYRIVSGEEYGELKVNSSGTTYLVGKADGKVSVVACITNEYGTFESESVEITVGTGEPSTNTSSGGFGTVGVSAASFTVLLAGCIVALKKKKEY